MATSNTTTTKIPEVPSFPHPTTQPQLSHHVRKLRHATDMLKKHSSISTHDTELLRQWLNIANRKSGTMERAELAARSASLLLKALCVGLLQQRESLDGTALLDMPKIKEMQEMAEARGELAGGDFGEARSQIDMVDSALDIMMEELKKRGERKETN